jgi:hypothetical protein
MQDFESVSRSFTDADLEQVCQALLLHATLKLELREKGKACVELSREYEPFRNRLEETLERLSTENEWGLLRMSTRQADLVKALLVDHRSPVTA